MFIEPVPWADEAKCLNADPDVFFPEKGGSTREAKRICAECTVQDGVPGLRPGARRAVRHLGRQLSERERRKLKRLAS